MLVRDFARRERSSEQDLDPRIRRRIEGRRQFLLRLLLLPLTGLYDGVGKVVEELPDSLLRLWGERSPRDVLDFSNFGTGWVVERSGWCEALPESSVELSASLDGPGFHLLPAA